LESLRSKPLPVVTEENRPFWEGCLQGKLLLQQCSECHLYQFYPRLYCLHCNHDTLQWVEVRGRGTIYSYTIIHQNKSPEFGHDTPYNVAIVQLEEGPRLLSNIVDIEVTDLKVDLPVTVIFDQVNETIAIPRFRPLREDAQANQK
jgi:uncharacterized OB-fold protein